MSDGDFVTFLMVATITGFWFGAIFMWRAMKFEIDGLRRLLTPREEPAPHPYRAASNVNEKSQ